MSASISYVPPLRPLFAMVDPRPLQEPHTVDPEELSLMASVKQGDRHAFDTLVDRLWESTFLFAYHLTKDREWAHDVAQESFFRLWQRRNEWEVSGAVRSWLFRTARNLVISEARKAKVRQRWELLHTEPSIVDRTPLQDVEAEELRAAVQNAIQRLPEKRREVFSLFHIHGMSRREIAEIMEIEPQSVANHLHRALADLKVSLKSYFPALASPEGPV
jgi:RNA polymerase sigma-70 factor, ECF subfamily